MVVIALSVPSIPSFHRENRQSKLLFLFVVGHLIILCQSLCSPQCRACSSNNCSSCLLGYYPQKQLCLTCKQGCQTCIDSSNCLSCSVGYKYDNQDGQCYSEDCSKIKNCIKCNNRTCVICWPNYSLQNGSCFKKQIQNSLSKVGVILSISVSLSAILIIMCCIIACKRKRSLQAEEVQRIETAVNIHRQPFNPIRTERKTIIESPKQWLILIELYNLSEPCCICLDQETQISTNCNHYFHENCFYDWNVKQAQCPYCRAKEIFPLRFICCKCHEYYFETGSIEAQVRPPPLRYCPKCSNI